jgi:hypothetical protein
MFLDRRYCSLYLEPIILQTYCESQVALTWTRRENPCVPLERVPLLSLLPLTLHRSLPLRQPLIDSFGLGGRVSGT